MEKCKISKPINSESQVPALIKKDSVHFVTCPLNLEKGVEYEIKVYAKDENKSLAFNFTFGVADKISESCEYKSKLRQSFYFFPPVIFVLLIAAVVLTILMIVERRKNKIRGRCEEIKMEKIEAVVEDEAIYEEIAEVSEIVVEVTVENDMYGVIA